MAEEQWLTFQEAVEIVRTRLNASIGRSEAWVRRALASGEVRTKSTDPVLLMTDDGVVGMDLRPGAKNPGGVNADGKPLEYRYLSKDDLLDRLDQNIEEPKQTRTTITKEQRVKRAKQAIWGTGGPPDHMTPKAIATAVNEHFAQIGEPLNVSDKHIIRNVK